MRWGVGTGQGLGQRIVQTARENAAQAPGVVLQLPGQAVRDETTLQPPHLLPTLATVVEPTPTLAPAPPPPPATLDGVRAWLSQCDGMLSKTQLRIAELRAELAELEVVEARLLDLGAKQ